MLEEAFRLRPRLWGLNATESEGQLRRCNAYATGGKRGSK